MEKGSDPQAKPWNLMAQIKAKTPKVESDNGNLTFTDASFSMKWSGDSIKMGDQKTCRGWKSYHPGHFYVIRKGRWNAIERMMETLQAFYNNELGHGPKKKKSKVNRPPVSEDARFKFDKDSIRKGLYVAVHVRGEWHRGLILQCFSHKNQDYCKTMLIDFGEHQDFKVEKIRRIPQRFLENFPAQAIKCSLLFEGRACPLNATDFVWTSQEAEEFCRIMQDCLYHVEFIRAYPDDIVPNQTSWKVRVQVIQKKKKSLEQDKLPQVADQLLKRLQESYENPPEKQRKKHEQKWKLEKSDKADLEKPLPQTQLYPLKYMESCSISHLEGISAINVSLEGLRGLVITENDDDSVM